jgi:hypothetical protein
MASVNERLGAAKVRDREGKAQPWEAGDRLDRGQPHERVGRVGHGWFLAAITALAAVGSLCVLCLHQSGSMGNRVFRIRPLAQ